MIGNAEYFAADQDLADAFAAGDLTRAEYIAARAALADTWSVPSTLAKQVVDFTAEQRTVLDQIGLLNLTGTVATVGDLPGGAANGDTYVVSNNGHAYIRLTGVWKDLGPYGGRNGVAIFSVTGAPAAGLGIAGDLALDLTSGDFYGPKDASGWGAPVLATGLQAKVVAAQTARTAAETAKTAAEVAAATVSGIFIVGAPDAQRITEVDAAGRKSRGVNKAGWNLITALQTYTSVGYRSAFRRQQIEDKYGLKVGEFAASSTTTAPHFIADSLGRVPLRFRLDGTLVTALADIFSASIRKLRTGSINVEDATGGNAGRLTFSRGAFPLVVTDALGRLASYIKSSGVVAFPNAEAFNFSVRKLKAGDLAFEDANGNTFTRLARSTTSPFPMLVDPRGVAIGGLSADGMPRSAPLLGASRFAGGHFDANATYTIECRRRVDGSGGHDVWRIANSGAGRLKLNPDNEAADCLSPKIISTPTGDYVVYLKRIGRRLKRVGVPIAGGAEVPFESDGETVAVGDSYVHPDLITGINAARSLPRPIITYGSGGSMLKGDRAALLGGTVTSAEATGTMNWTRGGLTTVVDNGNGTYTYPGKPEWKTRTLLLMQGALENPNGVAELIGFYKDILNWMTPVHKRLIIMQASVPANANPAAVAAHLADWAAISSDPVLAGYCCSTYDYMRANGGGGTVGSAAGEVWALNNYALPGDPIHMNATGQTNLGARIATAGFTARNW